MAEAEELLIVKGKRIVLPDCTSSGCIIVQNGKIVGIERGFDSSHMTSGAKVSLSLTQPNELLLKLAVFILEEALSV